MSSRHKYTDIRNTIYGFKNQCNKLITQFLFLLNWNKKHNWKQVLCFPPTDILQNIALVMFKLNSKYILCLYMHKICLCNIQEVTIN